MGRKKKSTSESLRIIRPAEAQLRIVLTKGRKKGWTLEQIWRKYQIRPSTKRGMVHIRSKSGREGNIPTRTRISRAVKKGWSIARM